MAVATLKTPEAPTRSPAARDPEWWLRPLQWAALLVWVAIPVSTFLDIYHPWPAHVVWSGIIASLPLFIILVGYHRWRRICPLAFFSQIPVLLRRPGTRRASPWLEEHYYYIMFGVFAFALWLRLVATNGNAAALATFFVLLSITALVFGALFTGKTWCNYICPVSLIEKINTEPHGLRETPNSQCTKCTACKKSCPDINEENGYWKEIGLRSKRFAYFAFPGLVFGFYFYFYLQDGTWGYYFTGGWADQTRVIYRSFFPDEHAMSAGFFFLPEVPRALAAALTLAAGVLASYWLFSMLDTFVGRLLRRAQPDADAAQARHVTFALAAFVAFITFYVFAGQPLMLGIPWLANLFEAAAITTGAVFLARRISRTQRAFAEQSVALNIVKRWEWPDMRPPANLHDAVLIHTARLAERKMGYTQVLDVYRDAVRDALGDGFVTREDVQRLESLRNQLQVKKTDHEQVMAMLAEEERALLSDPSKQASAEKHLQLETYRRALEGHLRQTLAADAVIDDRLLRQLRQEYNVTDEEHAAQLAKVLGSAQGIAEQVAAELGEVRRVARTVKALAAESTPTLECLADLLRRKRARAVERLMDVLDLNPEDPATRDIRSGLCSDDNTASERAFADLNAKVTAAVKKHLLGIQDAATTADEPAPTVTEQLREQTESLDPFIRAAALLALADRQEHDAPTLRRFAEDQHEVVRETALRLLERGTKGPDPSTPRSELTTIEKMVALRVVPFFTTLAPESLAELSRSSVAEAYPPDALLCREGEEGDEAFIVLAGTVRVYRATGTQEEKIIGERGVGDIIGEMAVLDPAPRSATIRAGTSGVLTLRLEGAALREVLRRDPAVAQGIITTLTRRLRLRGQIDR